MVGYLRLNRNIGTDLEDLQDREEIRLGGRLQVTRFWSVFGSTVIDLTDAKEDPISVSDGYEPVRQDRKSVVSGTSVSVSVDLVGSRIIKKKNINKRIKE